MYCVVTQIVEIADGSIFYYLLRNLFGSKKTFLLDVKMINYWQFGHPISRLLVFLFYYCIFGVPLHTYVDTKYSCTNSVPVGSFGSFVPIFFFFDANRHLYLLSVLSHGIIFRFQSSSVVLVVTYVDELCSTSCSSFYGPNNGEISETSPHLTAHLILCCCDVSFILIGYKYN